MPVIPSPAVAAWVSTAVLNCSAGVGAWENVNVPARMAGGVGGTTVISGLTIAIVSPASSVNRISAPTWLTSTVDSVPAMLHLCAVHFRFVVDSSEIAAKFTVIWIVAAA